MMTVMLPPSAAGAGAIVVPPPSTAEALTIAEVWALAAAGTPIPPNTLAAVNLEYASLDRVVRNGDEVAFFPPVTGG